MHKLEKSYGFSNWYQFFYLFLMFVIANKKMVERTVNKRVVIMNTKLLTKLKNAYRIIFSLFPAVK
jgi:hypothetical protein